MVEIACLFCIKSTISSLLSEYCYQEFKKVIKEDRKGVYVFHERFKKYSEKKNILRAYVCVKLCIS